MKTKKPKYDFRPYPEPVRTRSGAKVGWNYYTDKTAAEECSAAAQHNAGIKWELGYDFGYCSPGSIKKLDSGEYEVCLP